MEIAASYGGTLSPLRSRDGTVEKSIQDWLPGFVDLLLDAIFLVRADGRIEYVSAACEPIFGYRPEEMTGKPIIDFVAPQDRDSTCAEADQIMAGRPRIGFENRYVRKDGRLVNVMWSARWWEAERLRIGVARDVSEQRRAEALQAATYAVSEAAHNAADLDALFSEIHRIVSSLVPLAGLAVAICDRRKNTLSFPYGMDRHGGATVLQATAAHRCCADIMHSGHPMVLRDGVESWLAIPLMAQRTAIGALLLQSHPGISFSDKDQELLHFVSAQVATAIERTRLHAELLHAARYDELTGLPNRRLFQDRIHSALERCKRHRGRMAVLFVDIDDFKQVNDSLGHAAGDQLLREIALRLRSCVRQVDTVARLGGDEFVILLEEIRGPDDAANVAGKIRDALWEPVSIDGHPLETRASLGVALYPEHGTETGQLLRHADSAMYSGKKARSRGPGKVTSA